MQLKPFQVLEAYPDLKAGATIYEVLSTTIQMVIKGLRRTT